MAEWVMALNMDATLTVRGALVFSETARSRDAHRKAVGHGLGRARREPVLAGRLPHDRLEGPAERAEAREADVEADLGHAALGLTEQEHGALDAAALQVAVRRLAERRAERADEVRLGDERDPRERSDVERLRVRAVHRVAGAKQPAVGLLGSAAHAADATAVPHRIRNRALHAEEPQGRPR